MSGINRARGLIVQRIFGRRIFVRRVFVAAMVVSFTAVLAHANSVSISMRKGRAEGPGAGLEQFGAAGFPATLINRHAVTATLSFSREALMTGSANLHDMASTLSSTEGSAFYKSGFSKSYLRDNRSAATIMTPVAEPGSLVLMGTGLMGLAFFARRKLIARVEQGKI